MQFISAPRGQYHEGLVNLAVKPSSLAQSYSGCIVNGYRFNTKKHDSGLKTSNHGVLVRVVSEDGEKNFYGTIDEIIKISYPGDNHAVLFKCNWFNVASQTWCKTGKYGIPCLHKEKFLKTDEIYILADQAEQVMYVDDLKEKGWVNVVKTIPRDVYNISDEIEVEPSAEEEEYEEDKDLYTYTADAQQNEADTLPIDQAGGLTIHIDDEDLTAPDIEQDDIDGDGTEEEDEAILDSTENDTSTDEM